jgi:hypothetical protein
LVRPVEKHLQARSAELQIPPLRYAPVGMTKGRVALSGGGRLVDEEQQVPPLRYASVGMTLLFIDLGTEGWEDIFGGSPLAENISRTVR